MERPTQTKTINVQTPTRQFSMQSFDTPASLAITQSILEGKTYPLVSFLKDVKCVVDIGANVGAASLFFALHYPLARIFSFEPSPEAFCLLKQNTEPNSNIQIFDFGLFDRDCRVPLFLGKSDQVTNSIGSSYLNGDRSVEIVLRDARHFFRGQQIDTIDILKIDTEGCELPILQSMADLLEKTKVIYVEYHDEDDRLAIDVLLRRTHILAGTKLLHPHRGELCYISYQTYPSPEALDQLRIRHESVAASPDAIGKVIPFEILPPTTTKPRIAPVAERFGTVIQLLQTVNIKLLQNREFLVSVIRAAGVRNFGLYDEYAEDDGKILQDPHQLADALVLLTRYKVNTFVEIGTWDGHTACFLTAILLRFNPNLQTICIDPRHVVRESYGLPVQYRVGTSDDVRGLPFDLAFIDGDHTYAWVERDYNNIGTHSPVCMFHDIDNEDFDISGPGKFWEHLKQAEPKNQFFEFKYPGKHFMGIGVRIKQK